MSLRSVVAVAVLVIVPTYAIAAGQNADREAQALLERAIAGYADGALVESSDLLHQAAALARSPVLLGKIHLYIGLADAAANRTAEARRQFRRALSHDPSLDLDPEHYKRSLVELFRSVRRSWEGTLEVSVNRLDVEVWVGSRRAGRPPVRLGVPPGSHIVEIRDKQGRTVHHSSIRVVSGDVARLDVALTTVMAQPPAVTPSHHRRRLWTWVVAGAAAAVVVAAVGTGLSAKADNAAACGLLAGTGPCDGRRQLLDDADRARYGSLYRSASGKALAANISWGAAASLAAGALVLYFLEGRSREGTRPRGLGTLAITALAASGIAISY